MYELGATHITKQVLLNNNTEEKYLSHYLGINPSPGLFKSPMRKDSNPTCSFFRAKNGDLVFKDFGDGFTGNFINIVMTMFNVPYYKALDIIANDFGIISKSKYTINPPKIEYDGCKMESKGETILQCEIKPFTKVELDWWLKFGIKEATLKHFKVFSVDSLFLNFNWLTASSVNNPIYGYYFGKEEGRELWKIYFPFKSKSRFMLNNSKLQGAKQLPKTGDYVVVTKSMKDVMTLYELGIPAVAPQAESVIITERQYQTLSKRFKHVIFNYDWDNTGIRSMIQCRQKYKSICISFTNKKTHAKDISDYVAKVGLAEAQTLINDIMYDLNMGEYDYQFNYVNVI